MSVDEVIEEYLKDEKIVRAIQDYLVYRRGGVVSLNDVREWLREQLAKHPNARIVKLSRPLLTAAPDHDAPTYWGAYYVNMFADYAERRGFTVVRLNSKQVTKKDFILAVEKNDPIMLSLLGHGNERVWTGYNNEVIIQVGDEEMAELLKGRIISFLSCLVGAELAPWLVDKGVRTIRAYDEEFIFVIDPSNYPDSYAWYFMDSHFTFDRMMVNAKTAKEAHDIALERWQHYLEDPRVPEVCKPYLLHDMKHDRLFGDPDARITEPEIEVKCYLIDEEGNEKFIGVARPIEDDVYGIEVVVEKPGKYKIRWEADGASVETDWFTVKPSIQLEPVFPVGGEEVPPRFMAKVKVIK